MSSEQNIKAAQSGYAAFGRRDIQGILALLDEHIEWVTPELPGVPASGAKRGHEAVAEFFRSLEKHWEFEAFEQREFIASGDLLAVQGYYRVKSRQTGLVAESPWVMVWRFHNGKCVHFQEYTDTAALAKALTGQAVAA